MNELIKTFHIEFSSLLAQLVNFTIVLLVLYKFAYKPILKVLNERTKKIEKGLNDSKKATQRLEETTEKEKEILKKAKLEAQKIIVQGEETAKKNQKALTKQAQEQNQEMLQKAEKQIKEEKKKIIIEAKKEVADLVMLATQKIIAEKLDKNKDQDFIEKIINK